QWQARTSGVDAGTLAVVRRGTTQTIGLLILAGLVTIVAAAITVRTAMAADKLVAVQSQFMSSVTHEMKTPIALVRLAGDTFANRRYTSDTAIREYGQMLTAEADRLTRLVDNVLGLARTNDPKLAYSFEPVDLVDLIEESVDRFRLRLGELAFEVELHL